ncbi:hypothetical protein GO988_11295 [Hymenobacter sp. HMF4947]|uniref:HTH cro/C1-type domain-containing protein n=1 Tax=Hymenobacter ginkgonis TaxID=2682976 RepID=A0A7K1TES0_9BACT|nr:helix-turn-helix transcriptional regulator [Hymenobacter ginkgonis]MVN76909.1 hypothetical protein [Hymenobacter ginkgonis]
MFNLDTPLNILISFEKPEMEQVPIGQRLKILISALDLKVRTFAQTLGVSETTVRNYLERGSKPSSDFLENILTHFEHTNPVFLLTGKGEPLFPPTNENKLESAPNQKFFRSPVIGNNQGTANQQQHIYSAELDSLKNQLLLAEKDVESLRAQLQMKDALLASKDETITLLRVAFNRPT